MRKYRNTNKFAQKLLQELLFQIKNSIEFELKFWKMRIVLDEINDTITIEDYIPENEKWRCVVKLYLNEKKDCHLDINTELGGINSNIQALILFLMLNISHNGSHFFINR